MADLGGPLHGVPNALLRTQLVLEELRLEGAVELVYDGGEILYRMN